jgi:hypothetical protein
VTKGKLKRLAAKVLLVIGGLFIGCLAAEIVLRIAGYSYPIFYRSDPDLGYAPIPDLEGWFWVENKTYVRYNSQGFHDREHSREKPADTVRIAVLGDSFAEARQVPMESAFWAVMERRLQDCGAFRGKRVEAVNFGVSGYGTAGELLMLRQKVWDYSPDIVLLAFTTYNDIADNYRAFKGVEEIPYFNLQDGRLVYDGTFRGSAKYKWFDSRWFRGWISLHNSSRFIQLLHHAQFALRTKISTIKELRRLERLKAERANMPPAEQAANAAPLSDLVGVSNMIYREPKGQDWKAAWDLTEALVKQIRDDVNDRGARFVLMTISTDIQVYPDPSVRRARMTEVGVEDLFYPNRRLEAFARKEGMTYLDLAAPMQSVADADKTFFHGFGAEMGSGHWNEAGHRFAGELVSDMICRQNPN